MNIITSILKRRNIIKWTSYLFSYHIVAVLCTLLAAKIYTNWFEPEVYAVIGKFIFIITISVGIFGNWLNTAITRYAPERIAEGKETGSFFLFVFKLVFISCMLLVFLTLLFQKQIFNYLGVPVSHYLIFIVILNIFIFLISMMLQALNKFGHSSLIKTLERVFYLFIALVISKVLFTKDPMKFLDLSLVKGIIVLLMTLIMILFSKNIISHFNIFKGKLTKNEKKDIIKFSIPCIFGVIIGLASNWIDFFLVTLTQTDFNTGLYFLAVQINNILVLAVLLPATVLTPKLTQYLTEHNTKVVDEYTNRFLPFISIIWIIGLVFVIIFINFLLEFFFSQKFLGANKYIQLLTAGSAGMMFAYSFTPIITFYKDTKKLMYTQLIMFCLNLLLAAVFIKSYQTFGICLSKAISLFLYPLIVFLLFPYVRKFYRKTIVLSFFIPVLIVLLMFFLFPGS